VEADGEGPVEMVSLVGRRLGRLHPGRSGLNRSRTPDPRAVG
jgi:hypothetical protein